LELIGARQAQLGLAEGGERLSMDGQTIAVRRERAIALPLRLSDAEREEHRKFIATLGENALWKAYLPEAV